MNAETGFSQEGFDAVSRALERLYSGQEGIFYRTVIPYALGGKDPLDGIEVWKSEHGVPHWHYVTYGFTELYEKESDISQESGYGFELTFRLKRGAEEQPPAWPVNLLQNLARYVFSTGNGFGPGHHMSCNGPIALDTDTKLTALGFRVDPELGELDTPNGHMRFLQAVALTGDEMEAMMCWDGQLFLEELERCTLGGLRRAVFDGDVVTGSVMTGQVAGMLHEIRPLRAIFQELYTQGQAVLRTTRDVWGEQT